MLLIAAAAASAMDSVPEQPAEPSAMEPEWSVSPEVDFQKPAKASMQEDHSVAVNFQ